jgi:hypothetical protein
MASFRFAFLLAVFIFLMVVACRPAEIEIAANQEAALSVTPSVRMTPTPISPAVPVPMSVLDTAAPLLDEPASRINSAELRPASAPPYVRHAFLDVDMGMTGQEGRLPAKAPDVLLLDVEGSYWLQPVNGAGVAAVGLVEPGYAGCWQVANDFLREPISARTVGSYFCVLTNLDRLAQVKIDGMDGERVRVTVTTWADSYPQVGEALMTVVPEVFTAAVPAPTLIPDAPIYASGVAIVAPDTGQPIPLGEARPHTFLDLDSGITSESEGDIHFVMQGSSQFKVFWAANRVRIKLVGAEPTVTQCDRFVGVVATDDYSIFDIGSYLCVRTDHNRLAMVYAEDWGDGGLSVRFVTWDTGGDLE